MTNVHNNNYIIVFDCLKIKCVVTGELQVVFRQNIKRYKYIEEHRKLCVCCIIPFWNDRKMLLRLFIIHWFMEEGAHPWWFLAEIHLTVPIHVLFEVLNTLGIVKTLTWWNCGTSFWGCCIFAFAAWFAVNRAWCAAKHCWLRMYELGKCTNKINSLLKYQHKLSVLLPSSPNKITWKLSMYVCISRAQLTTKMNKLG